MGISELQQTLHSVARKGSLDSFGYQIRDTASTLAHSSVNTSIIPSKENGLQLTLF